MTELGVATKSFVQVVLNYDVGLNEPLPLPWFTLYQDKSTWVWKEFEGLSTETS